MEVPFKAGLTVYPWYRANYTRSAGLLLFIQSCVRVMSEGYGSYSKKSYIFLLADPNKDST
jgi:hypothetical protein